ncbi:hypothetical protein D3C84_476170 [compost metagenome]
MNNIVNFIDVYADIERGKQYINIFKNGRVVFKNLGQLCAVQCVEFSMVKGFIQQVVPLWKGTQWANMIYFYIGKIF